jgi:hypothetical protein
MATKTKSRKSAAAVVVAEMPPDLSFSPALSTEDRLFRIRALGERIERQVEFICSVSKLPGASAEAKDRAVAVFHERLLIAERQLDKVQEELQLG